MTKMLTFASALALGLALVAGAGATAKPPTFDKRFSCARALPTSFLNGQYAASGWSDAATFKGAKNSVYAPNAASVCSWSHPNGDGGGLAIVYGPGAAKLYARAKTTSNVSAAKACQTIAARGGPAPSDPRSCGAVPVSGFGAQAFENVGSLAVLRGDVFIEFSAGEKLVDGAYMGGNLVVAPSSVLEAVMNEVLAKLPRHS